MEITMIYVSGISRECEIKNYQFLRSEKEESQGGLRICPQVK
jgi:hypothetical protein